MAESAPPPRDILSEFWAPVCAIGSHGEAGPNAQICVSVLGASVVPERPRLLVSLWKSNYTHELVSATGTMSVTVLSEGQAKLVPLLGMRSGRDGDKLGGTGFELDVHRDPVFGGGAGTIAGEVLEALDMGDATTFLVAVRARTREGGATLLSRWRMNEILGPEFQRVWADIAAARAPVYRAQMVWREIEEGQ